MKNYIAPGDNITLAAPYVLTAGQGALVGFVFGVATSDAANGADVVLVREGIFDLAKVAATAIAANAKVYWDNAARNITTTAAGNTLVGVAIVAALAADTTVTVLLDGAIR